MQRSVYVFSIILVAAILSGCSKFNKTYGGTGGDCAYAVQQTSGDGKSLLERLFHLSPAILMPG
jgi:hypothetical protein